MVKIVAAIAMAVLLYSLIRMASGDTRPCDAYAWAVIGIVSIAVFIGAYWGVRI
jgi:ribosomal protein L2